MKFHPLFLILLTVSCAHKKKAMPAAPSDEDLVSVGAAINQARMSYLRGCVEAYKDMRMAPSFPHCVEKAKGHGLELQSIMDQEPVEALIKP